MRMMKISFALIAALAMSACGGSTGATTAVQAKFLANQAMGVINALRLNQKPSISSVPGANPGGQTVFSFVAPTCVTQSPVSTVDMDGDSIPLTQTSSFDCSDQSYGVGYSWGSKGEWKLEDSDDTKKWLLGGYKSSWDFDSYYVYPSRTYCSKTYPAGRVDYEGKGTFNLVANSANAYIYTSNYLGNVVFVNSSYSGDYTYEGQWSGKVVPSSTATNTWDKGSIEYSGYWQFVGNFPDEEEHQSNTQNHTRGNVLMTLKTTDLIYDNTCGAYYRSGSFEMDYGNGSTFKIVYACDSADTKYYFNGVEYDPNAATASPTPSCT